VDGLENARQKSRAHLRDLYRKNRQQLREAWGSTRNVRKKVSGLPNKLARRVERRLMWGKSVWKETAGKCRSQRRRRVGVLGKGYRGEKATHRGGREGTPTVIAPSKRGNASSKDALLPLTFYSG